MQSHRQLQQMIAFSGACVHAPVLTIVVMTGGMS